MKSATQHVIRLIFLFVALGVAACGGGSGNLVQVPQSAAQVPAPQTPPPRDPPILPPAPPSSSPGPTSVSPYYLATGTAGVLRDGSIALATGASQFSSGHLVVVDPASPTTPVALEAAGWWAFLARFEEGVIDSSAGSVSKLGPRFLAYLKDGRVYRLDLRRGNWPPAPVQTSSLMTTQTCSPYPKAISDQRSPERSLMLFLTAGPDQVCKTSDDSQVAVRLDMSSADSPVAISGEVIDALRSADGAITGFLVRVGNRIQRVDAGFANPIELFTVSGAGFELAHDLSLAPLLNGHLVFRDGAELRAYNSATASVPVTLMTLDAADYYVSAHAADADAVYFAVSKRNSDAGRVIRVTANLTTDVLATESISIIEVFVSPTRVIYGAGYPGYPWDGGPYDYRSVPKSGGTPITLVADNPSNEVVRAVLAGENLWVAEVTRGFASTINWVNVVRSDGQDFQQLPLARIVGFTVTNPTSLLPGKSMVRSITIAHDVSASTAALRSAMLRNYEGATRAQLFEFGSVPAEVGSVFVNGIPQWEMPSLLSVQAGFPLDVFFYQSNASGLTRVTNFAP